MKKLFQAPMVNIGAVSGQTALDGASSRRRSAFKEQAAAKRFCRCVSRPQCREAIRSFQNAIPTGVTLLVQLSLDFPSSHSE
jgi:hypothetical protein